MYQALLDLDKIDHTISFLWKLKIPLKIKVFSWMLYKKVIFTKDNLVKRNWHENEKCCFYNQYETGQHLFVECVLTKFIWREIQIAFGISSPPPTSINHMLGLWVLDKNANMRELFVVGICIMFWVIWLNQNDIIFDKNIYLNLYVGNL
jgi:hypothetical protein